MDHENAKYDKSLVRKDGDTYYNHVCTRAGLGCFESEENARQFIQIPDSIKFRIIIKDDGWADVCVNKDEWSKHLDDEHLAKYEKDMADFVKWLPTRIVIALICTFGTPTVVAGLAWFAASVFGWDFNPKLLWWAIFAITALLMVIGLFKGKPSKSRALVGGA